MNLNIRVYLCFFFCVAHSFVLVSSLGGKGVVSVSNPNNKNSRVTNGTISAQRGRPYQVGLFLDYGFEVEGFCSGTLISANLVLTAGHCVRNIDDGDVQRYTIVVGAYNLYDPNELGTIRLVSTSVIEHPGFNPETTENNLAIIILPVAVAISERVKPVELLPYNQWSSSHVGIQSTVSGWGVTDENSMMLAPFLQQGNMQVAANSICSGSFAGLITDTMLCTSGLTGVSTCRGDSGGPLTYHLNEEDVLIGIASFTTTLGCGQGHMSVFTRVARYMEWITNTIDLYT